MNKKIDEDNLSNVSYSHVRDLNPVTTDSNGLRALVEVHIEDYKEKNLKDFALWESFKNNFSVWTCEMWDK
ncbi:hypothetical protein GcM3_116018, partial [Golovinomyces cichoracearum]